MGCSKEPEQLELEIDVSSYEVFRKGLMGPPGHPGPLCRDWNRGGFNPSVQFLSMWTKANDFVSCATWTKKLELSLVKAGLTRAGSHLIRAFGSAFRGDEVGALGRDILEYALHQRQPAIRAAALELLEHWLEDDEEGTWLDISNDHLDRESDQELKGKFRRLVQGQLDLLEEDAMYDTFPSELEEDMDEDISPELEDYLALNRKLTNRMRGQLETAALPGFLWKMLDVPTALTLGILESLQIGELVAANRDYEFLLTPVSGGHQVRARRLDGAHTFSLEPTATEGHWLVFTRFVK